MPETTEPYDFAATLQQLDELDQWLRERGLQKSDRVRQYRANIRKMIEVEEQSKFADFIDRIPYEKAREILWSYVDADELVRTFNALRKCPAVCLANAPIKEALDGPADAFCEGANNNAGRNYMFELVVAGRLAQCGYLPRFHECYDLSFKFAEQEVGIECKRPLNAAGMQSVLRSAVSQLGAGTADLKLIAVSVSRLINPGDPRQISIVASPSDGLELMMRLLREIAEGTKRFWYGKSPVCGLFLYAFTPLKSQREGKYYGQHCELVCPASDGGLPNLMLRCLSQSMDKR